MKKEFKPLSWKVLNYDCNAKEFKPYDILKYREDFIKQLKKKSATKEEFAQGMKSEMMYRYWSKCEAEVLLTKKDGRIIMSPWVGPEDITLDVTDREDFDWVGFFDKQAERYINKTCIKIDIYSQLQWRWSDFIDYCWYTRLKYQRDNPKFHKQGE